MRSDVRQRQIGEVAEAIGVSIPTIRHWDQAGLVSPSARSAGGFRLYTDADVERLLVIRRMKPLGFSIEEMGELLAAVERLAAGPSADDRATVRTYREQAEQRRARLATELGWADEFVERLNTAGGR